MAQSSFFLAALGKQVLDFPLTAMAIHVCATSRKEKCNVCDRSVHEH